MLTIRLSGYINFPEFMLFEGRFLSMEIIHSLMSRLGAERTAGFLIITGCLSAVTAFVAITGLRERKAPAVCLVLAVLYGAVLVTVPALLLVPFVLGGAFRGFYVIAFLVYIALLMVKVASRFPASPWSAARLVILPWAFALFNVMYYGISTGGFTGHLADEYLVAGLITFTAFWISFPFLFFDGDARARISARPGMAMLMIAPAAVVICAGISLVYRAWMVYLRGDILTGVMIGAMLGVAVSVVVEVIEHRRFFRSGMM